MSFCFVLETANLVSPPVLQPVKHQLCVVLARPMLAKRSLCGFVAQCLPWISSPSGGLCVLSAVASPWLDILEICTQRNTLYCKSGTSAHSKFLLKLNTVFKHSSGWESRQLISSGFIVCLSYPFGAHSQEHGGEQAPCLSANHHHVIPNKLVNWDLEV